MLIRQLIAQQPVLIPGSRKPMQIILASILVLLTLLLTSLALAQDVDPSQGDAASPRDGFELRTASSGRTTISIPESLAATVIRDHRDVDPYIPSLETALGMAPNEGLVFASERPNVILYQRTIDGIRTDNLFSIRLQRDPRVVSRVSGSLFDAHRVMDPAEAVSKEEAIAQVKKRLADEFSQWPESRELYDWPLRLQASPFYRLGREQEGEPLFVFYWEVGVRFAEEVAAEIGVEWMPWRVSPGGEAARNVFSKPHS